MQDTMTKPELRVGHWLERDISDGFRSAQDIGAWLESIGERVQRVTVTPRFMRVLTKSGIYVYSNGWVCKAPWA